MKKTLILSLVTGAVFSVGAQLSTRVDQYFQDFSILNPSTINAGNKSALNLFYNKLYTDVKGSPTNLFVSAVFPNPDKHVGFGFNFSQEKVGFSTLYNGYVSYVYSVKMGKKSKLHAAATVGLLSQRFNPNAIDVINQDDPYYLSLQQGKPDNKFDLKVSASYQAAGLLFGFSTGRLTQPKFNYDYYNYTANYALTNISNGFISTRIKVSKEIIIQPVVSVNVFDFKSKLVNYGMNILASDKIWMGVHNAGNKNLAVQLGGMLRNTIRIGYSYSMPYSSTSRVLGSGHEFFTSIILGKTSDLVKDVDYDAISVKSDYLDTTGGSQIVVTPDSKDNSKQSSSGNVVSVDKIKISHDTIVIGSFEDIKFLRSGYDTSKILLKNVKQEYPENGYYVTIGTFRLEENANRYIKIMYMAGYTSYKFYHPETKYYYVYILHSESNEEAEQAKWQEQLEFPDIWVKRVFKKQ